MRFLTNLPNDDRVAECAFSAVCCCDRFLERIAVLDAVSPQQGLRAFGWQIGGTV